ncbi:MAG TPA: hypothetical protein DCW33_00490 [Proteobacteria bacterium]|nr:hypothetical protein [Pseudomonadota bacterium]
MVINILHQELISFGFMLIADLEIELILAKARLQLARLRHILIILNGNTQPILLFAVRATRWLDFFCSENIGHRSL